MSDTSIYRAKVLAAFAGAIGVSLASAGVAESTVSSSETSISVEEKLKAIRSATSEAVRSGDNDKEGELNRTDRLLAQWYSWFNSWASWSSWSSWRSYWQSY